MYHIINGRTFFKRRNDIIFFIKVHVTILTEYMGIMIEMRCSSPIYFEPKNFGCAGPAQSHYKVKYPFRLPANINTKIPSIFKFLHSSL